MVRCEGLIFRYIHDNGVKGLELIMDSTSARTVIRESSVNVCCNNKAFKIRLIVRMIYSHAPLM